MNPRFKKYAENRANGMTQRRAAIEAGYSEKTVDQSASRLENRADVKDLIARYRAAKNPKTVKLIETMKLEKPTKKELGDPLQFFSDVMSNERECPELRLKAAQQLAAYTVPKPATKKPTKAEERQEAAETSFFATALKAVK